MHVYKDLFKEMFILDIKLNLKCFRIFEAPLCYFFNCFNMKSLFSLGTRNVHKVQSLQRKMAN